MGLFSELKLAVPWGHIAAKAWGSQKGSPILCLHGWLDNANSFDRLIPLLPRDFYYVAMDFGGHGLSSHYSPGLPYYYQNFVGEIRRVSAALKWDRFSIMGHSFGGTVGGMFSCMFPEMVDKLILLDSSPFALDSNELENLLTYKRKAIEHTLLVEQAAGEPRALRPQEMLQRLLKNNSHVGEECGELLLQRGATQVPAGLVLNRDRRIAWPEHTFDFISKELCAHAIKKLQAHTLLIKVYRVCTRDTHIQTAAHPQRGYSHLSAVWLADGRSPSPQSDGTVQRCDHSGKQSVSLKQLPHGPLAGQCRMVQSIPHNHHQVGQPQHPSTTDCFRPKKEALTLARAWTDPEAFGSVEEASAESTMGLPSHASPGRDCTERQLGLQLCVGEDIGLGFFF
ncbi:serine hydrolase-like protein 2 isoform X2 [Myotis myotis]|uniref:serine hydrolase-like protein 2 isoform X2 n=1 Tax=Myotis myotis TaxID=51298 RepID=UPI00174C39A7|nr:serine hydrolase-like protein 2 isoform X2 [Myotis myotis]